MDMADLGNIGRTIRRLRTERNWTLKVLSDRTGIQPATLSRMENNKMIGTLDAFNALSEAFKMKLSKLFQECEKDQAEADDIAAMEAFISEKEVFPEQEAFPEVSLRSNLN